MHCFCSTYPHFMYSLLFYFTIAQMFTFLAKEFDAAKYFDTHPALVNRRYNRPRLDMLRTATGGEELNPKLVEVYF